MARGYTAVDTRIHAIIVFMGALMLTDVNVVSRQYWGAVGSAKQQQRLKLSERITRSVKRSMRCAIDAVNDQVDAYSGHWMSCCEIMQCPAMNAAFAAHVERCVHYSVTDGMCCTP
jgi:hypothetical protein